MSDDAIRTIGTLRETSLHAALKVWYARPGDELEASVEGFQIDLRRGSQLIEIQTRNFAALKRKLTQLVERHPVRLVHPIAQEKWIVRLGRDGATPLTRRKSPKRGRVDQLFAVEHSGVHHQVGRDRVDPLRESFGQIRHLPSDGALYGL